MRTISTNERGALPESSFKYNPLQHLRWVYLRFLQGLFYASPRGQYHWEPENDDSEILISDENPVNVDTVGPRPCITLTRAAIQFFSLGFDDMLGYDFATGAKKKTILMPGTMMLHVCSRVDIESENLAYAAAEHLWLLRDVMMRQGFYDVGRNIQIGAVSPAGKIVAGDSAQEWFATTIVSPFHMFRTSQLTPLGEQLAGSFEISLTPQYSPIPNSAPVEGRPQVTETSDSPDGLPRVSHPLNPTRRVVVRQVRPNSPLFKPPSIGTIVLPITSRSVEESEAVVGTTITVKA